MNQGALEMVISGEESRAWIGLGIVRCRRDGAFLVGFNEHRTLFSGTHEDIYRMATTITALDTDLVF